MIEHEKHCVDHCPTCEAEQHDGYDDLEFYGDKNGTRGVFVRFRCGECGTEYVERYTYDATWYETGGVGWRYMIDRDARKAFVEGPLQEAAQVANGYVSYLEHFDEGGAEGVIIVYEDDSKAEVVIDGMSLAAAGAEVLASLGKV